MLPDKDKTKEQLIDETTRQRVTEFAILECGLKWMEEALRESEEKYRTLFQSTLDGVFVINAETMKVALANQSAAKIYGFDSAEGAIGANLLDFVPPEDRERVTRIIVEDMFAKDLRQVNEFRTISKDGREVWISAIGVRTEYQGRLAGLVSIRDITERKEAEEALRESEEKYRSIFDKAPVSIMLLDKEGRIVDVNPHHITNIGKGQTTKKDYLGKNLVTHPSVVNAGLSETYARLLKGEAFSLQDVYFPITLAAPDRYFNVKGVPLFKEGKVIGAISIREDITERKRAEERERELQQELNLASRLASIGELAAGVAHELNNPLTGIIGFSERLLRKGTDETSKPYLQRIYDEASRAAKVVENLRTFARRREPKKEYSDVNDIVQKALELRAYELKTSNIQVALDLAPTLPMTMVDFLQIQEAFLNIIFNAEQTITEANLGGKLIIKTRKGKDYIKISFADDGPGIPADQRDKIFNPFFTTRGDKGGTGLGLSICHGIVAQHNGKIYVKSRVGKGATFFVELPVITEEIDEGK